MGSLPAPPSSSTTSHILDEPPRRLARGLFCALSLAWGWGRSAMSSIPFGSDLAPPADAWKHGGAILFPDPCQSVSSSPSDHDGLERRVASRADHYTLLGVSRSASTAEIKAAYRGLVKRHHPDAGGSSHCIVALNAAWEVLGDLERRRRYDGSLRDPRTSGPGSSSGASRSPEGPHRSAHGPRRREGVASSGRASDAELLEWLRLVYSPIDRLLGQVINGFPSQLRALAADPYDDLLMETFCAFLEQSQGKLEKVDKLYRSRACPATAGGFGLSLYHCLSQVQDALVELERYTMGYVDSYLRDGTEMLREAKRRRRLLKEERRRLEI